MAWTDPDLWREWLATPLSGATHHHVAAATAWHGRLMVLAWAVLLPAGVLAARFLKVMPRQSWPQRLDDQRWWRLHLGLQSAGLLVMLAAVALAWSAGGADHAVARWHVTAGYAVAALGLLQAAGGSLRGTKGGPTDPRGLRGDHYDMTVRRRIFEWVHKVVGYVALGLGAAAIATGLVVADAPRWMAVTLLLWTVLVLAASAWLQWRGACIDTYQAIWGIDNGLPGLGRRPIGWGIRRHTLPPARPPAPPEPEEDTR